MKPYHGLTIGKASYIRPWPASGPDILYRPEVIQLHMGTLSSGTPTPEAPQKLPKPKGTLGEQLEPLEGPLRGGSSAEPPGILH